MSGFGEFIYKSIVPATFVAPMKSTFDMNDAQTILVCILALLLIHRTLFCCIVVGIATKESVDCAGWEVSVLYSGIIIVIIPLHFFLFI